MIYLLSPKPQFLSKTSRSLYQPHHHYPSKLQAPSHIAIPRRLNFPQHARKRSYLVSRLLTQQNPHPALSYKADRARLNVFSNHSPATFRVQRLWRVCCGDFPAAESGGGWIAEITESEDDGYGAQRRTVVKVVGGFCLVFFLRFSLCLGFLTVFSDKPSDQPR
jgi:hypothetical protein